MPFPLVAVLVSLATSFVSSLLTRNRNKPSIPRAATLGDFNFPTAEEARPIPYVAGTVKLAPNYTYFGDLSSTLITKFVKTSLLGTGQRVPLGYRYNVGQELALCFGPNVHLKRLTIDDKELYSGDLIGAPATVTILKENLFGGEGEDGDGGVNVILDFYEGNTSQTANPYMATRYARQNGHRGVSYAVWRGPSGGSIYDGSGKYISGGGYIGKVAQVRPLAFYLQRTPDFLGSTYATVGTDDANVMNVIWEVATNRLYGAGLPTVKMDGPAFQAAAATLHGEGIGCSVLWERTDPVDSVIQQLVDIADCALYQSLDSGLITVKLIRNDYDPMTLIELTDDDVVEIVEYTRGGWSDTKNEIRVNYTSRADDYRTKPALAQDLANQRIRVATDSEIVQYGYVTTPATAERVAARDLRKVALPLARATLIVKRIGSKFAPGDVLKWSTNRTRPTITSKIMRVVRANYSNIGDGRVTLELVEDVFTLGANIYAPPPASGYVPVLTDPTPTPQTYNAMQPYWFAGGIKHRPWSLAQQPDGSHLAFDLQISTDGGSNYDLRLSDGLFTPLGTLHASYSQLTADVDNVGFELVNVQGLGEVFDPDAANIPLGGGLMLFEDTGEIVAFEDVAYNSGTGRYVFTKIWRGLLDTTPKAHSAGTRVWIIGHAQSLTDAEYALTTALKLKHQPRNANGQVPLGSATAYNLTVTDRAGRPYPPSYFRVDGSYTGNTHTGDVLLEWNRRNKLTESQIVKQSQADVAPEATTTYTLIIRNASNTIIHTEPGLTGTSFTYTTTAETADNGGSLSATLTFELKAVLGSLESESWVRTSTRV